MQKRIIDYYKSHSIWVHLILFIVLFLVTYALRHYLFLDDNLLLQSDTEGNINNQRDLERSYKGIHFIWGFFNVKNLFSLFFTAFILTIFSSIVIKLPFKTILKVSIFALTIFVFENLAYTFYYLVVPPEIVRDMNVNVLSLQNLFEGRFLRYFFGELTLFNLLYLLLFSTILSGLYNEAEKDSKLIYLVVIVLFIIKILLSFLLF